MKVKEIMQKKVFTVSPEDLVDRVFFLLHYEKIRHLPVVDETGEVVGIVSDRDLYKSLGPRTHSRAVARDENESVLYVIPKKVRHIMRRGVSTVSPKDEATRAASIMARRKIGALPVVEKGKLRGILTSTDILLAFSKLEVVDA